MQIFGPPRDVERRTTSPLPRGAGKRFGRVARALLTTAAVATTLGVASAGGPKEARPKVERGFSSAGQKLAAGLRSEAEALFSAAKTDLAMTLEAAPKPAAPAPKAKRVPSALTPALKQKGWNACMVPDPGFGPYGKWQNVSMGQMIMPKEGGHTEDFGYDVVVHFHGHEAVRHGFVEVARGAVLVGIDLGVGSGPYEDAFALKEPWTELVKSIEKGLIKTSGDSRAHIRHLALSSWSAGYGAVNAILKRSPHAAEAVILLDSLHTGYVKGPPQDMNALHGVWAAPIEPTLDYARRAANGDGLFVMTHSRIRPPTYAATWEVADYLLNDLGIDRVPASGETPLGGKLLSRAEKGNVSVAEYAGEDEVAHCEHTELLAEIVRDVLEPRWDTPPIPGRE